MSSPLPRRARPFQGERAGIASRTVAVGIDLFVALVILALLIIGASAIASIGERTYVLKMPSSRDMFALTGVVVVAYAGTLWGASGRTFGNHVMGLRVLTVRGTRWIRTRAYARAVLYWLVPIGLLWCVIDRERRSVQDLIFGTAVVYDWGRGGGAAGSPGRVDQSESSGSRSHASNTVR